MSTVTNKLLAYHLSRLQDKDPNVRMKAIKELELIGDVSALDPLQKVFLEDPDVVVRKAAQDAGRAIFLKGRGE